LGREKKKIARIKLSTGAIDLARQTNDNGKSASGYELAFGVQFQLVDLENVVPDERFTFRAQQCRLHVAEIDALHRLGNVHLPGGTALLRPIPIVNPISRVAVLLNLYENVAAAERVHSAAREQNRVAGFHFEGVQMLFHFSLFERFREPFLRGSLFYAGVKPCLR
jgi:hypothetical protein